MKFKIVYFSADSSLHNQLSCLVVDERDFLISKES